MNSILLMDIHNGRDCCKFNTWTAANNILVLLDLLRAKRSHITEKHLLHRYRNFLMIPRELDRDDSLRLDSESALTEALSVADLDAIIYFIKRGANIPRETMIMITWLANSKGSVKTIDYLIRNNCLKYETLDDITSLFRSACNMNHLTMVKYWIHRGVDARLADNMLSSICREGNLDILRYLIRHGADINANNNDALRAVCSNGHLHILRYLRKHGIDLHINKDMPMRIAVLCHNSVGSFNDETPLDQSRIIKYLIKCGLDYNAAYEWKIQFNDQSIRFTNNTFDIHTIASMVRVGAYFPGLDI